MQELLSTLLSSEFMPHGYCLNWKPALVWLHVVSDALIALSYYSIPLVLFYFVRKRKDLPFSSVFVLFGLFILACGTTHLLEVWTLWVGSYGIEGLAKLLTAAVSVASVVALVRVAPQVMELRPPEEVRAATRELKDQTLKRRQAEEELERFFDLSLDMFGIADFEGYFRRVNPAWEKVLGYTQEELVAKPYLEFVHPADRESTIAEAGKLAEGQDTVSFANRYRSKSGEYRWFSWTARSVVEQNVIYCVARDFTEQRRGEEQLKSYARDLENAKQAEEENAARLKAVVKEMEAAKSEAEEATRAKSDFLANMSHEIRTPIYAVVGMTELALGTKLSAEQREYLTAVRESADTLLALVNDILDFSKIEARMLELDEAEFNFREEVEESVKTLAFRAEQKNLELACHVLDDVPPRLVGDPARLRQVLVNLVGNAIKFTDKGEVVVRVEVKSKAEQEAELHFAVRDTGIGIPREKQELIFDAFAQADSSMTRKYGGTGLGLAISAQIVKLMGGRIWVESERGKGSTFHFTARFPLAEKVSRMAERPELASLRDVRTLVVDDNATNRRILEETLKRWQMRPTLAEDAPTALEILRQEGKQFRLALIDSQMPEMDGFTLAEQIRSDPELAEMSLVMLTSASHAEDFARCRQIGMNAFLTKPVKQSDLLRNILRALDSDEAEEGGEATGLGRGAVPATQRLRVLLAEDNPINQKLTTRMLEKRGHDVETAANGQQVLEMIEKAGPVGFDLVLMDVQMPRMNGFEATAAIREKEKVTGKHLPIVAMTAHALKGDREECLKAGMDSYLPKPIDAEALFEAIEGIAGAAEEVGTESAKPESAAPEKLLDEEAMLARTNGDRTLLGQLIGMFLEDTPKKLDQIQQAVESEDPEAVHHTAHSLKGSIAIFLPNSHAHRAALKLETMGREEELSNAKEGFAALKREMDRLHEALRSYLAGLTGTSEDTPKGQSSGTEEGGI